MRSSVDFPQPDGPSSDTNSPARQIEIDVAHRQRAVRELLGDLAQRDERRPLPLHGETAQGAGMVDEIL